MVQTITKYFCDLCKKEADKDSLRKIRHFPVTTRCNWTDGMPTLRHVEFTDLEVCPECLLKITNIEAGFQGSQLKLIQK